MANNPDSVALTLCWWLVKVCTGTNAIIHISQGKLKTRTHVSIAVFTRTICAYSAMSPWRVHKINNGRLQCRPWDYFRIIQSTRQLSEREHGVASVAAVAQWQWHIWSTWLCSLRSRLIVVHVTIRVNYLTMKWIKGKTKGEGICSLRTELQP